MTETTTTPSVAQDAPVTTVEPTVPVTPEPATPAVTPEPTTTPEPATVTTPEPAKQTSVAKLLSQRNEAREELADERAKNVESDATAKKVIELEELVASQTLAAEAKVERHDFFAKNDYAKEFEADIDAAKEAKWLSYEEATKLVIAEKKPELLLEDAVRNKMSGGAPLTGTANTTTADAKNPQTTADLKAMSPDDFLAWSNNIAKTERTSGWLLR